MEDPIPAPAVPGAKGTVVQESARRLAEFFNGEVITEPDAESEERGD
jgi:hypothetical protein